jgi:radical SAM superfamily enzyme YgiQ (UPF0313 family)
LRILVVYTNTYSFLNPSPLGASLVAARLRRDGHDVRFVDLMFEKHPEEAAAQAAREHQPELSCFSIRNRDNQDPTDYFDPIPQVTRVIQAVREAAPSPALLGGTAFTTYPSRLLVQTGAEWGLCGDDLEPISRFVASLAAGAPDRATPGLVYRAASGALVENPFQVVGYQHVPFDNYALIDFARYRRGYWQAGVVTRSGCPERCVMCDTFHTFGRRFVLRDPGQVADDLLQLKRTGKVKSVFLVDAGFNRPLAHAKEVLREILRRGAQLQLYSVFDPGEADDEYLSLYRRAGGSMVMMFAESFSDPVLAGLQKQFTWADVERDAAALRRAKVAFMVSPTFGGPGETKDTVRETLERSPGLKAAFVQFGIGWRIQPRTPLRDRAVAEGLIAAEDDCYQPHFYLSKDTPRPWLEEQLRGYKRRHPFQSLNMVPAIARMMFDWPWRRGPEAAA